MTSGLQVKDALDKPVEDGDPSDPTEFIATTYFQLKGYLTSSNKWFYLWQEGKKQRGFRDIDVLAVNGEEVVIVSVTQNLDDKIPRPSGKNPDLSKVLEYFQAATLYLKNVPQYSWLFRDRKVKYMIVYSYGSRGETLERLLKEHSIEIHSLREIIADIIQIIKERRHMKSRNLAVKLLQEMIKLGLI